MSIKETPKETQPNSPKLGDDMTPEQIEDEKLMQEILDQDDDIEEITFDF